MTPNDLEPVDLPPDTCSTCGAELHVGDWPYCPHGSTRERFAQSFDPVVVHRDAEGNIRYPAHVDAPVPAGFQKVELRTIGEIRNFEAEVNLRERAKADQHLSRRERDFSEAQSHRRRELRSRMEHMSPFGADFARLAMERGNNRSSAPRDVGFHIDVFSNNSSNREAYRDAKTEWRGRKA